jgi:N6-L-threonylcarbamoyladenine synthase
MYILGIETSCDETSCAILKNYKVLSNVTISSLREHKKFGGVVPEIATRAHLKNIDRVLDRAQKEAKISLKKIDLIAATYRPGLIGALVIGLNFAKALSFGLGRPFIGIDHLHAHLFAPFLNNRVRLRFPFLGVVVSGGHTELYRVDNFDKIAVVGSSRDDACGEVFDKVAGAYNLGYPGGPAIDRMFDPARSRDFSFKCGKMGLDVSFSGIKTALIYKKNQMQQRGSFDSETKVSLVSSFQQAVVDTLINTIDEAAARLKVDRVVCGGGVIANSYLRKRLRRKSTSGIRFHISPLAYAGDNAAIVAGLGFYLYNKRGIKSPLSLQAEAN